MYSNSKDPLPAATASDLPRCAGEVTDVSPANHFNPCLATIRADNHGGLTYYQSRGFRDWHYDEGVSLASGQVVDKISKRYDV